MFGKVIPRPVGTMSEPVMVALGGFDSLRGIKTPERNSVYIVTYGDVPGDNWGGKYVFDDTSTLTESLPHIVRPNNVPAWMPGRFIRF
jgi:hypothetical protein